MILSDLWLSHYLSVTVSWSCPVLVCVRVWRWQSPVRDRCRSLWPEGKVMSMFTCRGFRWGSLRLCEEQGVEDKDVRPWMFGCVLVMRSWDTSDSAHPLGEFMAGRSRLHTLENSLPWGVRFFMSGCSTAWLFQWSSVCAGILMTAVVLISKQHSKI